MNATCTHLLCCGIYIFVDFVEVGGRSIWVKLLVVHCIKITGAKVSKEKARKSECAHCTLIISSDTCNNPPFVGFVFT
jgi:hypothetical protein